MSQKNKKINANPFRFDLLVGVQATTESHVNSVAYFEDRMFPPGSDDMLQTTTKQIGYSYNSLITKTNDFYQFNW